MFVFVSFFKDMKTYLLIGLAFRYKPQEKVSYLTSLGLSRRES